VAAPGWLVGESLLWQDPMSAAQPVEYEAAQVAEWSGRPTAAAPRLGKLADVLLFRPVPWGEAQDF
jgi:hypothetical protein